MKPNKYKMVLAISVVILLVTISLSFTGCASWDRGMKSLSSDMTGGLKREVIVYDSVGNEIYRQKGKFDVDYTDGRVLYDDEDNLRHVIYFENGIVIINELGE